MVISDGLMAGLAHDAVDNPKTPRQGPLVLIMISKPLSRIKNSSTTSEEAHLSAHVVGVRNMESKAPRDDELPQIWVAMFA